MSTPHPKLHTPSQRRKVIRTKASKPDDIPYSKKYDSESAKHVIEQLQNLYSTPMTITSEDLADCIYDKWDKYHKMELKDINGEVHLVIHPSSYIHRFIAINNYNSIIKRLNALHLSYHVLQLFDQMEYPDNKSIIISLGVTSYSRDTREDEWRV